ncbi:TetR/AcrR family transcriptional regulator [uncultured Jatrophihabitans sp.]|uniref:TetR/AcrR family transcriptional regulator n=1 Tax=uncultured Jatrophihabitans sp. TaxID=1610747 RepID=UPI0035C9A381
MTAVRRGRPGYDLPGLLAKSVTIFNERGFDGTSMEDLSAGLGISKAAIYHHVKGKDALLGLALDHALVGLEAAAEEVRALDGPAVDRLEVLVRRSVEVLVDRLSYVTLLLRVRGNSTVERRALARRRHLDQLVADLVKEAVTEGDLHPDIDPSVTARLLFGMVNSLTEWLKPTHQHNVDELVHVVSTMAFDGLRRTGSTR